MKTKLSLLVIIFSLFFLSGCGCNKKDTETQPSPAARKMEEINKLPISDRPYITLTPRDDGREITLTIDKVNNADQAEYELEYNAGSMIQGAFGSIDFSEETLPVVKKLLFGSCSKGKCRYDEDVSGGSLSIRFEGEAGAYVLKTDFNLQQMADRKGVFTTKDIKASLDVGTSGLSAGTYLVIASTLGLPAPVEGEVIVGPYAFLAASSPKLTAAEIIIKSKKDLTNARLLQWSGDDWIELNSEIGEEQISAPVTSLGTFVLVK